MTLSSDKLLQMVGGRQALQRAPGAVAVLLVLLVAWQGSGLGWSAVALVANPPSLPAPATLDDDGQAVTAVADMNHVASQHLFGSVDAKSAPAETSIDAPETRLNISLRGILSANSNDFSRAIIASGDNEKTYAIGAELPGGATIRAVQKDRVLINRGGQIEALTLPKKGADDGISYDTAQDSDSTGTDVATPDFESIRDKLANDPASIADILRYSPVMDNGQLKGYRIFPGRDRARFTQLGMQPGDVVTAINGTQMSDPAQAIQMLNSLSTADNVTLTIERGGNRQDITLSATR